jgi:hypothetical protein
MDINRKLLDWLSPEAATTAAAAVSPRNEQLSEDTHFSLTDLSLWRPYVPDEFSGGSWSCN